MYSFLESIKYSNHIFPLVFYRVYLSFFVFKNLSVLWTLEKLQQSFLWPGVLFEYLPVTEPALNFLLLFLKYSIGFSLLFGFLIRPFCLIAFLLSLTASIALPFEANLYGILAVSFLVLAWQAVGRSLGLDYYFYKNARTIWW